MNHSAGNQTYLDIWDTCVVEGYVVQMLYNVTHFLCILLGTPALLWCFWISLSLSEVLKPTQIFPTNLFAAELCFCVLSLLYVISYLFKTNDSVLRLAVYFFHAFTWICRPLFQSCICVERYMAVVQPVAFIKYRHRIYRVICSCLVWGLSLLNASTTLIFTYSVNPIVIYIIVGVYCLSVVVISLCCFFILRVLKQPGPGEVEGGRGGEKKQGTTDPQKMRAFRIVLTNLGIIVVSSISVAVGFSTQSLGMEFVCSVNPVLMIANLLSVMVSPLLHLHREEQLPCRRGHIRCTVASG